MDCQLQLFPVQASRDFFWPRLLPFHSVCLCSMPSTRRGIVWSLLIAILTLLLGLMGLLYVSYNRDKQLKSEIQNLRHKIAGKDAQIETLETRIRRQTPNPDTSQITNPSTDF